LHEGARSTTLACVRVLWLILLAGCAAPRDPIAGRLFVYANANGDPNLHFPATEVGGENTVQFAVMNAGRNRLKVSDIRLGRGSGEFSLSQHEGTLASGDSLAVDVVFRPTEPGTFADSVWVESNSGQSHDVRICGGTPGLDHCAELFSSPNAIP
jgi:hypothetical protein